MYTFVYGTLKSEFGNNILMKGCNFIGKAITTEDCFTMFDGGYPYVSDNDGRHTGHIEGELYEVGNAVQQRLDWLEGVPNHYVRRPTKVVLYGDGPVFNTNMYVSSNDTSNYLSKIQPIITNNNCLRWR